MTQQRVDAGATSGDDRGASGVPAGGRRAFLGAVGALVGGAAVGRPVAGQSGVDLSGWFDGVDGADGVTDARGRSTVEVAVGAAGNGGAFAFAPVVVRVDPGTTVRWRWTGNGGSHNVVAEDGSFESELTSSQGTTFEWTAESAGATRYACTPHKPVGMKGAVVVGDVDVSLGGSGGGGGSDSGGGTATPEATPTNATDATDADGDPAVETTRTFDGWFDGVDNYRGVVDRTGESTVEVEVGATGNGGPYAFDPPAIHVDPGTTVVWRWVGEEGPYDVVDEASGYRSEAVAEVGHAFAVEFDGDGLSRYDCERYADRGMRGAVLVGAGAVDVPTRTGVLATTGGVVAAALGVGYGMKTHFERVTGPRPDD